MSFRSILYRRILPDVPTEQAEAPEFFKDLNLDRVVAAVTTGKDEYDLKPFFHRPLNNADDIAYRHEVMKDLESPCVLERISSFAENMRETRRHLKQAEKLYYRLQKNAWFLDAVAIYCDAVRQLLADLHQTEPKSRGFRGFREYLADYVKSESFNNLAADTAKLEADLRSVKYCAIIRGTGVTVRGYRAETDYSMEIEQTFAKFRQGSVKNYRVKFSDPPEMNHLEAQILDQVVKLHPEIFSCFEEYCSKYRGFADAVVKRFDREIQFYVCYFVISTT